MASPRLMLTTEAKKKHTRLRSCQVQRVDDVMGYFMRNACMVMPSHSNNRYTCIVLCTLPASIGLPQPVQRTSCQYYDERLFQPLEFILLCEYSTDVVQVSNSLISLYRLAADSNLASSNSIRQGNVITFAVLAADAHIASAVQVNENARMCRMITSTTKKMQNQGTKRAWPRLGHVTYFKFRDPLDISRTTKVRNFKFDVRKGYKAYYQKMQK